MRARADATIFALSSGLPPAALAVVRISGPAVPKIAIALIGRVPQPRRATLCKLRDPADGSLLDKALVLFFPGPASATGEDILELQLHGGRAVVLAVLATLRGQPDMIDAEPGEFTRRAILNGQMDLTAAEGLADLIAAETEMQRKGALRIAEGGLRREIEELRDEIVRIAALIEADIDYADEADVVSDENYVKSRLEAALDRVELLLHSPPAERLRDGIRVVLAGPPNAGKSSLLNALAGREAAIVSPVAGTTRDRIELPLLIDGVPMVLTDTAGIRQETDDAIEQLGIARSHEAITSADVVIWLGNDIDRPRHDIVVCVSTKSDIERGKPGSLGVSAYTGDGLTELRGIIRQRASALLPTDGSMTLNIRQRTLLTDLKDELTSAKATSDIILVAEHIRLACITFDRLTGRADTEAVLDELFGRFCLGK